MEYWESGQEPARNDRVLRIVCVAGNALHLPDGDVLLHCGNFLEPGGNGASLFIQQLMQLPYEYTILTYGKNETERVRWIMDTAPASILALENTTTLAHGLRVFAPAGPYNCANDIILLAEPPGHALEESLLRHPPRLCVFGGATVRAVHNGILFIGVGNGKPVVVDLSA